MKPVILLKTTLLARVRRRTALAVFSRLNSGALVVVPGMTYPGGKKLKTLPEA